MVNAPETRAALDKQGVVVETSTPDELGAFKRSELARWGKVVEAAGATGIE